ncbi:hypothetical protein FRB90_006600 [Tulasnella sp. 427]|nr:hypothetical protein FRB90_006600 [Tulasnella sp. 427]
MLIDPLIRALVGLAPQVKTGTDPENELDEHEIAGEPEHDPELEHLSEDSGTEQRELEVYVMPESGIPRPKTKPVAADPLTKNLSGLGGRADYVLISHTLDDGEGVEDQFKEYITSLPEIPESRIGHQAERRLDDACVTVVEAKRLGRHGKPLIDAMPQAIAESLVLGARLKDESGTDK